MKQRSAVHAIFIEGKTRLDLVEEMRQVDPNAHYVSPSLHGDSTWVNVFPTRSKAALVSKRFDWEEHERLPNGRLWLIADEAQAEVRRKLMELEDELTFK